MNPVDPKPGQVGKGVEGLVLGQQLGLEAAHLAGRCAAALDGLSADDPPHRRIAPQPVGVVHVLISGETSIDGLTQQSDNVVPAVLARPAVSQDIARQGDEAKGVIEFPIGEQTGVRRDPWNSSFRRWSKQGRRGRRSDSPSRFRIRSTPYLA